MGSSSTFSSSSSSGFSSSSGTTGGPIWTFLRFALIKINCSAVVAPNLNCNNYNILINNKKWAKNLFLSESEYSKPATEKVRSLLTLVAGIVRRIFAPEAIKGKRSLFLSHHKKMVALKNCNTKFIIANLLHNFLFYFLRH